MIYGAAGDDLIKIGQVPKRLTTNIDGGSGNNLLFGGPSKDTITTYFETSNGSRLYGRGGVDNLYINSDVIASGGADSDVIHARYPCSGGTAIGGPERDNLVFAGAEYGVYASIGLGLARFRLGDCSSPLRINKTIEGLEGSKFDDHLVIGQHFSVQDGSGQLLGRDGIDLLDSRNGYKDTVTT